MSSQPPSASAAQGSAEPATCAPASMTARSSSLSAKSTAACPFLQPEGPPGDDAPEHLVGPAPDREARGDQPRREEVAAERLPRPGRRPRPLRRHLHHLLLDVGG